MKVSNKLKALLYILSPCSVVHDHVYSATADKFIDTFWVYTVEDKTKPVKLTKSIFNKGEWIASDISNLIDVHCMSGVILKPFKDELTDLISEAGYLRVLDNGVVLDSEGNIIIDAYMRG